METVRLRPLCHALGFNATRPEQWISRGYFKPSEQGVPGRARRLTKRDAAQLLALVDLVDAGFDAAKVHAETSRLTLYKQRTYLVIATGKIGLLIPATERGTPGSTDEECTRVFMPGMLRSFIVPEEKLLEVVTDPHKHVSIIVSLDSILDRVNQAWDQIAAQEDSSSD